MSMLAEAEKPSYTVVHATGKWLTLTKRIVKEAEGGEGAGLIRALIKPNMK